MGLLDKAKSMLGQHADKADDAVDKVADIVDDKTGGKHTEKIDGAAEKVKDVLDKLDGDATK